MKIYFYDKTTNEYLGEGETDKDPIASKRTGEFVPLIPMYATTIKPMAALNNQIQVFNTDTKTWKLFDDFRQNFYKVDENLNVFDITEIGGIEQGFYLVTKEMGDEIKANIRHFKIENNKVVKKSDEEYIKETFELERDLKYLENDNKAKYARYNQEFSLLIQDKICVFDTTLTTQNDLLTAFAVCSQGETYNGWITNNAVELNLTLDDVLLISSKFKELSNVYLKWKYFKELIDKTKTIEEIEKIVINYEGEV